MEIFRFDLSGFSILRIGTILADFFNKECEEMAYRRGQEKNCRDPKCDFIIAVVDLVLSGGHGGHVGHVSDDRIGDIHNLLRAGGVDDESSQGRSKEGWETSDAGENTEGWSEMLQTQNINLEEVILDC